MEHRSKWRCAAAGKSDVAIAKERFSEEGLDGLWDIAPGRGRRPLYGTDKIG